MKSSTIYLTIYWAGCCAAVRAVGGHESVSGCIESSSSRRRPSGERPSTDSDDFDYYDSHTSHHHGHDLHCPGTCCVLSQRPLCPGPALTGDLPPKKRHRHSLPAAPLGGSSDHETLPDHRTGNGIILWISFFLPLCQICCFFSKISCHFACSKLINGQLFGWNWPVDILPMGILPIASRSWNASCANWSVRAWLDWLVSNQRLALRAGNS